MIMVFTGVVWRRWFASGRATPRITNIHLPNPYTAQIEFEDGRKFTFPAEFLRVQSPAADSKRGKTKVVSGRRHVGIMAMDLVGNYGIKIKFDDLHNTGIYTWEFLYNLGERKFSLMKSYIQSLRQHGLRRDP